MHAVVVRVTVNDREAATQGLRDDVIPAVSQAPGFVAGYWTRKEGSDQGLSMAVFESEDAASAAAERVRSMAPDAVNVDDVEIFTSFLPTFVALPSSVQCLDLSERAFLIILGSGFFCPAASKNVTAKSLLFLIFLKTR